MDADISSVGLDQRFQSCCIAPLNFLRRGYHHHLGREPARRPGNPLYDFAYDGGRPGSGGTGTLSVNGKKVASAQIERTIPFIFGAETVDVGMDLYTPVTPDYKKGDNKFNGTIRKVTIDVKRMNDADEQVAKAADNEENAIDAAED